MDYEKPQFERQELADKLKQALAKSISDSEEIQKILGKIDKEGYKLNVWMLIGIFLIPNTETDALSNYIPTDLGFTKTDLEWLKSIKIDINNLTFHSDDND